MFFYLAFCSLIAVYNVKFQCDVFQHGYTFSNCGHIYLFISYFFDTKCNLQLRMTEQTSQNET